jgi:arginase
MKKNVVIIENPSELGAGVRGAGLGPIAVRMEDYSLGSKIYSKFPFVNIGSFNHEMVHPTVYTHAKYIDFVVRQNENLLKTIQDEILKERFPLVISGDHSNAIGSVAALKDLYPDKKLGVIWIDAHADLHTPFTSPSGNVHGMPLGVCLGDGYSSDAVNDPRPDTQKYWSELTHLGPKGISPKILPEDLVLISIRDLEQQEWSDIDANRILNYVPARLLNKSMSTVVDETLSYLSDCDMIYVSFDVDSMDPSVSIGTGTSVENGLTLDQAMELLNGFCDSPKIACLEITEINPLIDVKDEMGKTVVGILQNLLL